MFEIIFLLVLGLIFLFFACIQDIKTTEISDWLCYSLIIFALGFRFFYSVFSGNNFEFFYLGLFGLLVFFILGNVFYYSKVFAGGDAKLMIALGAILPLFNSFNENLKVFLLFFLLYLIVGAVYGIFASVFFMSKNFEKFKKGFKFYFKEYRNIIFILNFFGLFSMILGFEKIFLFVFGIIIFIFPYLYFYSKSIDNFCMIKKKKGNKLIEGDWLVKDVKIGKKLIKASWEGLSKKDIELIKKSGKSVNIRYGVVYAPVFFISFLLFSILYFLNYINFISWFLGFLD